LLLFLGISADFNRGSMPVAYVRNASSCYVGTPALLGEEAHAQNDPFCNGSPMRNVPLPQS